VTYTSSTTAGFCSISVSDLGPGPFSAGSGTSINQT
jgi:hypothetical protein